MAALERNDPYLRDLNIWYRQYSSGNGIENLVLTETRAIKWLGVALPDWLGYVVLPDSSDPGVGVAPTPIDADHINIAKPLNRDAEVYVHISGFVRKATVLDSPRGHCAGIINRTHHHRIQSRI